MALPPNVFTGTVSGVVPQVLSAARPRDTNGAFTHPQLTGKITDDVVQL